MSAIDLESLIRHDRLWVLGGVIGATALAWLYLAWMVSGMNTMDAMGDVMLSALATPWTTTDFTLMFLMWAIMMVGMMLPSATPMIFLFAMVNRRRIVRGESVTPPSCSCPGTWRRSAYSRPRCSGDSTERDYSRP